jgi:hypothetical protein
VNLEQLQRAVFEVTRQPLTASERTRPRLPDGRSVGDIAKTLIKPNSRMSSLERLQVYNQQYWFRLMASFAEDFPGLRSLLGERKFEKLAIAYLNACPSESFTLRNLASRLETWLRKNRKYVAGIERAAFDMLRLEWAHIEAFDGPEWPPLGPQDSGGLSGDAVLRLQPHLHLLKLAYPVDELLLQVRGLAEQAGTASNAVLKFPNTDKVQRARVPGPQRVYLAVYRLDGAVYFKRLTREGFALLQALRSGKSLEQAVEASFFRGRRSLERTGAQLQEWFKEWSFLGWFAKPA